MNKSRRNFLKVLGGGMILAAGGLGYTVTRTPRDALVPWQSAGTVDGDPVRKALSYAILAPNPHNRQPWLVDLSIPNEFTLYVDSTRLLPHTDPFSRQITVGLGCFVELFTLAANEQGYAVEERFFPRGDNIYADPTLPVATLRINRSATVESDPLFAEVLNRRSNKEPYDTSREVSRGSLHDIVNAASYRSAVGGSVDGTSVATLRSITHDALIVELETPHTYKESVDLFRIGHAEVDANPDGIDFSGPMFEALHTFGMFTRTLALDKESMAYKGGIAAVLETTQTAMGHIWIMSSDNSRQAQIDAGRDWLRMNLSTTQAGIAIQPMSQALQEYPEMSANYRRIHDLIAPEGGTIQMLGRIGYGVELDPSPRWPLNSRVLNKS